MSILAEALTDTVNRYWLQNGVPPKEMLASRFYNHYLRRELEKDGVPFVPDSEVFFHHGMFRWMGVPVNCNLPTEVPTVFAALEARA